MGKTPKTSRAANDRLKDAGSPSVARFGVHYSCPGNGISHYVHLERFARSGELLG